MGEDPIKQKESGSICSGAVGNAWNGFQNREGADIGRGNLLACKK